MTLNFSVLLSIYGKEDPLYLEQSLNSIFKQSLLPSEVVIVKDGPLPINLENIIKKHQNETIKIVELPKNKGLSSALNEGLKYCTYEYVARMDTDDICDSKRFEKQISFLKTYPEIDILGTYAIKIDSNGTKSSLMRVPLKHTDITKLVWTCPFIHPTVIYKKSKILKIGGYNPNAGIRQDDYDLWFRCCKEKMKFANLNEPLLYYRYSIKNIQKNDIIVGWHRLKVGIKGCWQLKLSLIAYIGVSFPLIRSLLPSPLNLYFNKFMNLINPRVHS